MDSKEKIDILIVGDVMLDRCWLVRPQPRSQAHAGITPRGTIYPKAKTDTLGGAGLLAALLQHLISHQNWTMKSPPRLYVMGRWNPDELQPEKLVHEIKWQNIEKTIRTTTKFRLFEHRGSGLPQLIGRFDREETQGTKRGLPDLIECNPKFIVVSDFAKGIVTPKIIDSIQRKFPAAKWFIDSKQTGPDYLDLWVGLHDKLLVLTPNRAEAVELANAIQKRNNASLLSPIRHLESPDRQPSREIVDVILKLFTALPETTRLIIKLDCEGTAVALRTGNKLRIWWTETRKRRKARELLGIGCGDAFLAYLVLEELLATTRAHASSEDHGQSIEQRRVYHVLDAVERATNFAYHWGAVQELHLTENWSEGETTMDDVPAFFKTLDNDQIPPLFELERRIHRYNEWHEGIDLEEEKKRWEIASNYELFMQATDPQLELWRSRRYMGEFLTVDSNLGQRIARFKDEVSKYACDDSRVRPFVCLIWAAPGSGKSFFCKCLADAANLAFVEVNLPQLTNVRELSTYFDLVRTNHIEGRTSLVMLDEFESEVGGSSVIPFLLNPSWSGTYFDGHSTHSLGKCVFVMVMSRWSSNIPKEKPWNESKVLEALITLFKKANSEYSKYPKVLDLISRVNGPIITFDTPGPQDRVYLAVNFLLHRFDHLSAIERGVLRCFAKTELLHGTRSIEQVVQDVQRPTEEIFTRKDIKDSLKKYKNVHLKNPPANWYFDSTQVKLIQP